MSDLPIGCYALAATSTSALRLAAAIGVFVIERMGEAVKGPQFWLTSADR